MTADNLKENSREDGLVMGQRGSSMVEVKKGGVENSLYDHESRNKKLKNYKSTAVSKTGSGMKRLNKNNLTPNEVDHSPANGSYDEEGTEEMVRVVEEEDMEDIILRIEREFLSNREK